MDRNNTDFSEELIKIVNEYVNKSPEVLKKFMKDYQLIPFNYIMDKTVRGLLVYHGTGTGKTITAVSIAEQFRKYNRDVIVISPKSLQANFKKELVFFNKQLKKNISNEELEHIINQYKFVSSNASNMIEQFRDNKQIEDILSKINTIKLDNKIIIVDEAHNIFNSIVNGSKNANEFYDLIMQAKNIKVIFLTATPIINNVFEIVPALNMCAGNIYYSRNKKEGFTTILPESYDDFVKYFIDEDTLMLKNTDKLRNRILGLVSYKGEFFNSKYEPFEKAITKPLIREHFPAQLPIIIEKIKMSDLQCADYELAREKERLEVDAKKGGKFEKLMNKKSTSYRIKSRQISNIYIPDHDINKIDFSKITDYSNKFKKTYDNIMKHKNQLGLIYSTFILYGVDAFSKYLEFNGFTLYDLNNPSNKKKCYAVYTGDISAEDRSSLLKIYNSNDNKYGEKIQLLLISSTGAEGLSLKNCRHVHILEPYWNYERIVQVSARAVRYMSHTNLLPEEQNVQIYIYLSIFSDSFLIAKKEELKQKIALAKQSNKPLRKDQLVLDPPTDIHIFKNSIQKKTINDEMLQLLASISIECNVENKGINFNCYRCVADHKKLFQPDLDIDMTIPSSCQSLITAYEVLINNNSYYYTIIDNKLQVYRTDHNELTEVLDDKLIKLIKTKLNL